MKLRDYQNECVDKVNKLDKGSRVVVALATGLGKTATAAHIKFNKRMLWLSHRDELVRQPERYFSEQGYSYGIEKAGEHCGDAQVVSASVQSLAKDDRLHSFKPDEFDVIICDEAHHAAAPTYRKILDYFRPDKLIGLTATPKRGDGVRLTDVFDSICFAKDLKWGIRNNYLSRIRCVQVHARYDMKKVKKQAGDFSLSSIEHELSGSDVDLVTTKAYLKYCDKEKKQTLVFCPTVKICEMVCKTMRAAIPGRENEIQVLSQKCSDEERKSILEDYKQGKVKCIINCMILTEGTDLPETSVIINNRPSANESLYQQIIGRGTRLYEGKEYCLIIDVVGEHAAERKVCTAPTLFGIEPELLSSEYCKKLENIDLLEFTDELAGLRAESVNSIELVIREIELLEEETEKMIDEGRKSGMKAVADAYRKKLTEKDPDYDFGDIIVRKTPETDRYYDIQATYDGHIYLSKPDMLDKTVITVDIPGYEENGYEHIYAKSDSMPMNKAIASIHDFLQYVVPASYKKKWSQTASSSWAHREASDKQYGVISSISSNWGIRPSRQLNMLQAGDIIDLSVFKKDLKKRKQEAKQKIVEFRNRSQKELLDRKTDNIPENLESHDKQLLSAWDRLVNECWKEKKKLESFNTGNGEIAIPLDYTWFNRGLGNDPSDKQLNFIRGLIKENNRLGIHYNADIDMVYLRNRRLDMGHTGFIITTLMYMRDNFREDMAGKTWNLENCISKILKITQSNMPQVITISDK